MSQLTKLRSGLNRLKRRRQTLRWLTGYSALLVALVWTLLAVFLVDWLFLMNVTQRMVSLVIGGVALLWAFFRYTTPFLGVQEDTTQMALLVERNQAIDSDLVAAIQFEDDASARWGSRQLADAVVGYVADFSTRLNVFHGMDYQQVTRRMLVTVVSLVVIGVGVGVAPDFTQVFFDRMLLGDMHYPTKTRIQTLTVAGVTVESDGSSEVRVPFGKPVKFEVVCGGELPKTGLVKLVNRKNGIQTEVELTSEFAPANGRQTYIGELPRLVDSVDYQLFVGDAYTDPLTVNAIPLPVVEFKLSPTPPSYAAHVRTDSGQDQSGLRQIAVIEGSKVDLSLTCNNKTLKRAWLTIDETEIELTKSDASGRQWRLDSESPLANVTEPVKFDLQVEDEDGLSLMKPISGYVRLKADRPPRVFAMRTVKNPSIMPKAEPRFGYGARDDYGIAKLLLHVEVFRADPKKASALTDHKTIEVISHPAGQLPRLAYNSTDYRVPLEQFGLEKGDELKLEFEAFDYRGDGKSKSNRSESLVLQVTDAQGLLLALSQADELSAEQMDAIIERELSIGRD